MNVDELYFRLIEMNQLHIRTMKDYRAVFGWGRAAGPGLRAKRGNRGVAQMVLRNKQTEDFVC